jgi:triosephosphate isomerase
MALMRTTVIGANWKMDKAVYGTASYFNTFRPLVEHSDRCEILICPSFLDVDASVAATRGTRIQIGAQNLYWEKNGAFTGEVSGPMIRIAGCSHVIVGHSERRQHFGETSEIVFKKTVAALDAGLTPIVCVGEGDKKKLEMVLKEQFQGGIGGLSKEQFARIIIAHEPLWAIGSGKAATPETAAEAHRLVRALADQEFGADAANNLRILYGGSVKPDNARNLLAQPEIDGFIVGGASLDPVSFAAIVNC